MGDARKGLAEGKLVFELFGQKLAGLWELVKIGKPGERQEPWLLFKKRDAFARPHADYDVVQALPDSVIAKPLTPPSAPAESPVPKTDTPTRKLGKAARLKTVAALPGASKAELPRALSPQLATLSDAVPASGDWTCEPKWDGYRIVVARIEHGEARLITRNGHDWTDKMPAIARELAALNTDAAWLDGEIVVLGDDQLPSFGALQQSFEWPSQRRHRVLPLRRPVRRRLRPAQEPPLRAPRRVARAARVAPVRQGEAQRELRRRSRLTARIGVRGRPRRHHREATRLDLHVATHRCVAQAEVQATPGVRDRRLHRPRECIDPGRQPVARLSTTTKESCSTRAAPAPGGPATKPRPCIDNW